MPGGLPRDQGRRKLKPGLLSSPGAPSWREGLLLLGVLCILGLTFAWLVPLGSSPVGFDAWWSLLLGKTLATQGFPHSIPAAGWTLYADRFADKHLLLSGLLALVGGEDLGPELVPPLVWALALLQALGLYWALRILVPGASPLWLLLLPALSSTWIFRSTALRDLPLALCFLTPLLASLVRDAAWGDTHSSSPAPPGGQPPRWRVGPLWRTPLLSLAFCYSHGAWLLPLLCALLVGLGTWLQGRKFALRPLALLLLAWVPALLLRPDFPANLHLLQLMNFGTPLALLRGELKVVPTEFLPYSPSELLRWNTPLLVAGLSLPFFARAKRLPLPLLLPLLFVLLSGLASRRMLEIAVPFVILGLVVAWRPCLPLWTLALLLPLGWFQAQGARPSVQANRFPALQQVAAWLRENGRPGDVVWVSDWGLSSPLIYGTRGKGLVFTGVMDPTLMWAKDPAAWRTWQAVKLGQVDAPLAALEETFHPRFLVLPLTEAPPGQPPGSTAARIFQGLKKIQRKGVPVLTTRQPLGGRWLCYRLGW